MFKFIQRLKGDKGIWSFVALLALFSFMPVFSASSNLAYMNHGTGNTLGYLVKHAVHIGFGFWILYQVQKIQVNRFKAIAILLLPFSWLLIAATYFIGVEQGSATRWLRIPGTSITFQPSTAAFVMLMMFVAFYLSRKREEPLTFKSTLINLWLPVGVTLMLILPNNFSTAALIFAMVLMLAFTANYPLKYLFGVVGIGVTAFALFIAVGKFVNKTQPEVKTGLFHRVATWEKRFESFVNEDEKTDAQNDDYQIEKAKTAIATGGLYGLGPGKSVQKNFLPQSSSDFIFAIIVEEYGLLGGLAVLSLYMLLFLRFIITAHKAKSTYGKLLIIGLGFPVIFQALINMGVAVQLLPVTGQTLPLVSSGGSSIWMTFFAIGVILSATKKEEEFAEEQAERDAREAALQKLIDKQLEEERQLAEAEALNGVVSETKAVQS
ncbi:FtsW/RodA/SpoVE family cell cycle protein [Flavobacterium aurantiibacter]|uniref:Probable peptidoglycan glycosyltransferase FtsW n=1 Tax=Flavobacterium aurantiibacter TaxID=2023067 RepID=A0A255ZV40_9FLAO|nr:FtsW/RodA/SpoVE family cell cycle protein [Flavobacterium aurantiibacter]OYQ45262.1 cell division protein FtsW [Flavobacterium aurantiibacter]